MLSINAGSRLLSYCPSIALHCIVFAFSHAVVAGQQLLEYDQSWSKLINAQHLP